MLILALESSCDDCSVAMVKDGAVLSLCTKTQTIHRGHGGVVPELAGRSHLQLIDSLTAEAAQKAGAKLSDVDLVAATVGPGLIGSLLVGWSYARGLALSLRKRFCPIHHLEAHLWSAEIDRGPLPLPFLVLIVSGGHTLLISVGRLRAYEVLGSTLDDALGEAFDKVGKLVGLGFPAGADVDRLAAEGNSSAMAYRTPMADDSLNFSFSGLKTAVLYSVRGWSSEEIERRRCDVLASFQEAAIASIAAKVRRACFERRPRALVAAGGVAANSRLRTELTSIGEEFRVPCWFPSPALCMDNAAMVGYLAWKLERAGVSPIPNTLPRPRWPLEEIDGEDSIP